MYKWNVGDEITASRLKQTGVRFGGDGSDGVLSISSGTVTFDLGGATAFVKNYKSISITGTGQLAFSNPHNNGTIIILKSQGDVVITSTANPAIQLSALGGIGGNPGGPSSSGSTNTFYANSPGGGWFNSGGYLAFGLSGQSDYHEFGGGGGGNLNNGTSGGSYAYTQSGSLNWAIKLVGGFALPKLVSKTQYLVFPGGGGSGGLCCGYYAVTAYAGGRGGGALVIECGGALNFTGTINASGVNGDGPTNSSYGQVGGGGGAGGSVLILYNTLTANTGTINVAGGAGGSAGNGAYGVAGGAGSVGQSLVESFYD